MTYEFTLVNNEAEQEIVTKCSVLEVENGNWLLEAMGEWPSKWSGRRAMDVVGKAKKGRDWLKMQWEADRVDPNIRRCYTFAREICDLCDKYPCDTIDIFLG